MAFSQSISPAHASLSAEDLREISQTISRTFAPRRFRLGVKRNLVTGYSPCELLAISQQISREFAPRADHSAAKLVLLPIDPRHLFAYWHINRPSSMPDTFDDAGQLTLRIYSESSPAEAREPISDDAFANLPARIANEQWFEVTISADTHQQRIELPADFQVSSGCIRAELGRRYLAGPFAALAASNPTRIAATSERSNVDFPAALAQYLAPVLVASSAQLSNSTTRLTETSDA